MAFRLEGTPNNFLAGFRKRKRGRSGTGYGLLFELPAPGCNRPAYLTKRVAFNCRRLRFLAIPNVHISSAVR